jgi:hypothetical protein
MAPTIKAMRDPNESKARVGGREVVRACAPSELIVHYFLDDLSPAKRQGVTDHLAGCDLCSARLLALEIASDVCAMDFTAASPNDDGASGRARGAVSGRGNARRNRRTARMSVVALDDRELMTVITLPVDPGALAKIAELRPLPPTIPLSSGERSSFEISGGTPDAPVELSHWDLAISELYGPASFRELSTGFKPDVAA